MPPVDVNSLAGGVSVITGSATGLGLACARQCAQHGMHVVLSDVRDGPLREAAEKLQHEFPSIRVLCVTCDVTERLSVEKLRVAVAQAFKEPIVYLGANAGVLFPRASVLTGSAEEWRLTMDVNVLGVVNTCQGFVPTMVAHGKPCVVVTTASVAGLIGGQSGPYGPLGYPERSGKLRTVTTPWPSPGKAKENKTVVKTEKNYKKNKETYVFIRFSYVFIYLLSVFSYVFPWIFVREGSPQIPSK